MKVDILENILVNLKSKLAWYNEPLDEKRKDKKIRWTIYIEEYLVKDAELLGVDKVEVIKLALKSHNKQAITSIIKKFESLGG